MVLREEIPDPKKPKLWEAWIAIGLIILFLVAGMIFSYAGMKLNSRICSSLLILSQIYLIYTLLITRRKKHQKYKDEMRDRQRLRNMTIRRRTGNILDQAARLRREMDRARGISGKPWPRPTWRTRQVWDSEE